MNNPHGTMLKLAPLMSAVLCVLFLFSPMVEAHAVPMATPIGDPTAPVVPTPAPETPQPTEAIPSTPEPTEVEPEIPVSTPSVTPAGTPEESDNSISPMSVNPGGSLTGCTQNPANGNITSSQPSVIVCTLRIASYGGDTSNQRGRVERPALPTGFNASITVSGIRDGSVTMPSGNTANVMAFTFANGSGGYRTATVTINLTVAANVPQNTTFNATFRSCHAVSNGSACHATSPQNGTAIVTAQVPDASIIPLVEGTHYTFVCSNPTPAAYLGTVESTCTLRMLNAPLILDGIRIEQVITTITGSAGWTTTLRNPTTGSLLASVPGTYTTPATARVSVLNPTWSFKIRMQNTACPTSDSVNVNVSLGVRRLLLAVTGPVQYLVGKNVQTSVNLPAQVSLNSITASASSVPYSMTSPRTATANLVMRYSVTGCGSWNSSARIGKFVDPANPSRTNVPVLAGATQVSTSQNPAGTVTVAVPAITTIGEADTRIATGTSPGPTTVVVNQTIQLTYTVPANVPIGTYQSTVTVTTGSGP